MTEPDCFEYAVMNYTNYLRGFVTKAIECRALRTVESANATLAMLIWTAEHIRLEEPHSSPTDKLCILAITIGFVVDRMELLRRMRGDLFYADTYPQSFNSGDILGYSGPIPHEP